MLCCSLLRGREVRGSGRVSRRGYVGVGRGSRGAIVSYAHGSKPSIKINVTDLAGTVVDMGCGVNGVGCGWIRRRGKRGCCCSGCGGSGLLHVCGDWLREQGHIQW